MVIPHPHFFYHFFLCVLILFNINDIFILKHTKNEIKVLLFKRL